MFRFIEAYLVFLSLGVLSFSLCLADENQKRPVVIAVIQLDIKEIGIRTALLEEQLSNNKRLQLVDREHIDKVMREQEIAAISSALSGSRRMALGKLLKADLLVFYLDVKEPSPHCSIVISETTRGLRLHKSKIVYSDKIEDDVLIINLDIEKAIKKSQEDLRVICAVPPLVSRDLSKTHEHLQGAFAVLLENMLLDIPGVFVVELAEARAIAKELNLTGGNIKRSLPLYLMGEYRFDHLNEKVSPFIKIFAQQGVDVIGSCQADKIPIKGALDYLRKSCLELLGVYLKNNLKLINNKDEYRGLTKRANTHFLLGNYIEAAQLFEASFLLKYHQPEAHFLAMSAYGRTIYHKNVPILEAIIIYDQARVHLEAFLKQHKVMQKYSTYNNSILRAFSNVMYLQNNNKDKKLREAVYGFRKRLRATYLMALDYKFKRGELNYPLMVLNLRKWFNSTTYYNESLKENLSIRLGVLRVLVKIQNHFFGYHMMEDIVCDRLTEDQLQSDDYKTFYNSIGSNNQDALSWVFRPKFKGESFKSSLQQRLDVIPFVLASNYNKYIKSCILHLVIDKGISEIDYKRDGFEWFSDELSKFNHSTIQSWVKSRRKYLLEKKGPQKVKIAVTKSVVIHDKTKVEFLEIEKMIPVDGKPKKKIGFSQMLKVSDKVDLIYNGSLCLLKNKRKLKTIFHSRKFNVYYSQPTFDGKYAWVPLGGKAPVVVVVNSSDLSVVTFTIADGLPLFVLSACVGIGEGRLCLSGSTKKGAFIAILEITENGAKSIRVIHEALKQRLPNVSNSLQNKDLEVVFSPKFMMGEYSSDSKSWKVLLNRGNDGKRYLLIHIKTNVIELTETYAYLRSVNDIWIDKSTAYWVTGDGLQAINFESKRDKPICKLPEKDGFFMYYKGQYHLVGEQWWVTEDLKLPFRLLDGDVPSHKINLDTNKLFLSANYGLVFKTSNDGKLKYYQVVFKKKTDGE
ncbi:MAG: hypothetical protein COA79_12665 [Planctomycetota bacterium]|nr:MAG: hypothetical protein COA79_12665 [Planctomycetota bacterium]